MTNGSSSAPRKRRGWQIPRQQSARDDGRSPRRERADASPLAPEPRGPTPTMRRSVFGQVADVSEASLQIRSQVAEPIVTLRLERNDPHAGRIFVASVRLEGSDAVGFAHIGDWIEAVGTRTSAHLVARRCINHTTGAAYRQNLHVGERLAKTILAVFVLAFFAFVLSQLVGGAACRFLGRFP